MRRTLVSVVVGLPGVAALIAGAWAFQTLALPPPTRADRAAADAEAWFHFHRLSIDVFNASDRRFSGECLRGWHVRSHSRLGSVLVMSGGPVALVSGKGRIRFASGHRRTALPAFLAAAIGCTGSLASALTTAVRSSQRLTIERAYAANQPALALEVHLDDERLTIYLSPRSFQPLVALGAVGGRIATARLYLPRVTPAHIATFRRLAQRNGRPLP
jgi:hypothetical protein